MRRPNVRNFNPTRDHPWIVCTLASVEEARDAEQQGADAVEFRCDLALKDGKDPVTTLAQIREAVTLPILGTIRRACDGGGRFYAGEGDESVRIQYFEKMIPFLDAVDIELNSNIKRELIAFARSYDVRCLVSYHNILTTEDETAILEKIDEAKASGGDMMKFAYLSMANDDVLRLLKILRQYRGHLPITVTGMGQAGMATRILFPGLGSCMTYGYIEGKTPGAPGQIPIRALRRCLTEIKAKGPGVLSCSDETILAFMEEFFAHDAL